MSARFVCDQGCGVFHDQITFELHLVEHEISDDWHRSWIVGALQGDRGLCCGLHSDSGTYACGEQDVCCENCGSRS